MAARAGQVVVKQGSVGRAWLIFLDELDPNDLTRQRRRPVDLTLLDTAEFRFRAGPIPGYGPLLGGPCSVYAAPTTGVLAFQPDTPDTVAAGEFVGTLRLYWHESAGIPSPEIVPHKGYIGLVVEPV